MESINKIAERVLEDIKTNENKSKYYEHDNYIKKCKVCGDITEVSENGISTRSNCKCIERSGFIKETKPFRDLSIFSSDYEKKTFNNSNYENEKEKKFIESFKRYCNKFTELKENGIGISMLGYAGTGKTHLKTCIYNELSSKYKIISLRISDYFRSLRKSNNWDIQEDNILSLVKQADILMVDDIGSEKISDDWGKEKLFNLIDTAYMNNTCMILSSNLSQNNFESFLKFFGSDKICDRIAERNKVFIFDWESRRRKNKIEW